MDLLTTQIAKTHMYDAVATAFTELGIQCSSDVNFTMESSGGGRAGRPPVGRSGSAAAQVDRAHGAIAAAGVTMQGA